MISIIIPAHNESQVIGRCLQALLVGSAPGELDIVVVCNGCSDDTATVAREFGSCVRVIETDLASKAHALNLGDEAARGFPRIYADADVVITVAGVRALACRLDKGDVLAVAPTAKVDVDGCFWAVRAVFEIRALLPSAREGIGGSGVYALSEAGRRRFGKFPDLTADDGYVRIQFQSEERTTLPAVTSTVFPPRKLKGLIATKTRAHYGSFELARLFPGLWQNRGESNHQSLLGLLGHPRLWVKLAIYALVTIVARGRARKRLRAHSAVWERDDTSRAVAAVSSMPGEGRC